MTVVVSRAGAAVAAGEVPLAMMVPSTTENLASSQPSTSSPASPLASNATEEGHLYGSIGPIEISKHLKSKNLAVEAEMIKMDHPIKEANILSEVPLNLGHGLESKIQVLVVALAKK